MPQSSPRHFTHSYTAGCYQRSNCQRHLITDAAGAMFIYDRCDSIAHVEFLARTSHSQRQVASLACVHAAPVDGHQPCGDLVVWNVVMNVLCDEPIYLFCSKRIPISFLANEIYCLHTFS